MRKDLRGDEQILYDDLIKTINRLYENDNIKYNLISKVDCLVDCIINNNNMDYNNPDDWNF